jgi:hypothetical protein
VYPAEVNPAQLFRQEKLHITPERWGIAIVETALKAEGRQRLLPALHYLLN